MLTFQSSKQPRSGSKIGDLKIGQLEVCLDRWWDGQHTASRDGNACAYNHDNFLPLLQYL